MHGICIRYANSVLRLALRLRLWHHFVTIMPVFQRRFILFVSGIPCEPVSVYLAHTGDRYEGLVINSKDGSFYAIQIPVAGNAVDNMLVFMHISAYSLEQSSAESHTQQFFVDLCNFFCEYHHLYSALFHHDQLIHYNAVNQSIQDSEDNSVCIRYRYLDKEN